MAELEGFLCPLCKQDCLSVQELEAHYREAHEESAASKFKKDFVSFFENAFNISPKQNRARSTDRALSNSGSTDGENSVQEPVTNVSGINPDSWDPQEMGREVVLTAQFRKARDAHLADIMVATNRMVIRLEKLFRMLKDNTPKTAKQMKSVEQNVVHWKKDKEEKICGGCGSSFGLVRRRHHCRLCGDIRCKVCCHFMTLQETYPLLHDCPDYPSLAPPEQVHRKKFQFKLARNKNEEEEEEDTSEVRMCSHCKHLVDRRLVHLGALKQPPIVAFYNKMKQCMTESERLKPNFLEAAQVIWSGEGGPAILDASGQRQELLKIYESVDAISKRILSMGASDPSPRGQKLARSVRVFASNYLQQHLLTLPSLPTAQQLAEIKEQKEREAQEKIREIERQREQQRQQNALREAKAAAAKKQKAAEEESSLQSDLNKTAASAEKFFKDISKGFQSILPANKTEKEEISGDRVEEGGWMCNTKQVMRSFDDEMEDDPFVVQREQLLSYIAQAKDAKRFDEVRALEQSLRDIEAVMQEQRMSFGFT